MRSLVLPVLATVVFGVYADSTVKAETPSTPKIIYQRNSIWDVNVDAGIGFRKHGGVYIGFMGVNEVEDTTALPPRIRPSYGIGARLILGLPNSNTGRLNSYGVCGGGEAYFGNKDIPVRGFVGGRMYNADSKNSKLEILPFGIAETSLKIKGIDWNFGVELTKKRGFNILIGKRFF